MTGTPFLDRISKCLHFVSYLGREERVTFFSAIVYLYLCGFCYNKLLYSRVSSSVLGIGCIILPWHSLSILCNYFDRVVRPSLALRSNQAANLI